MPKPLTLPDLDGYYLTSQVCQLLPVTHRQLQWWDERGVLKPERKALHKRFYSGEQVEQLRRLVALRRAGVSLQEIRKHKYLKIDFVQVVKVTKPIRIGDVLAVPR